MPTVNRDRRSSLHEDVQAAQSKVGDPFEFDPVPLTIFIQDRGYLNNPELSLVQFDAVRHMEQIYLPETHQLLYEGSSKEWRAEWEPVRQVNRIALEWGKGSGKDHVCRLALARWVYLMQCLKNPIGYWGMAPQDYIHFLNIAASAGQATRAFFQAFRGLVKHAPVFKGKYEILRGRDGMGGGEMGKYEIGFDKNVVAINGHSGSASQEGLNLLGGIADEIGAFRTKAEVERTARTSIREAENTADAVVELMLSSGRTRFPLSFKNVYISFPRFKGDAIQQLRARGEIDIAEKGEASKWYVSGPLPTWDVNPRVSSKEAFAEDYETNRAMAEAKYECRPGLATNYVYRNTAAISAAFARRIDPPLTPVYFWGASDGMEAEDAAPVEQRTWQVRYEYAPDLLPYVGAAYAIHADMAKNQDRAGIAMCHITRWATGEWETGRGVVNESRPVVKLDFAMTMEADLNVDPPREVQLRWFRKLVWDLVNRGFVIARATMDGWQSEDSLQILGSRGIEAERVSCDVPQTPVWGTFQDLMYDGRFEGYYDELLVNEVSGLIRLSNGKVDHPDAGSKDMVDAVAASAFGALEAGGVGEGETPERADTTSIDLFGERMFGQAPEMMPEGFGGLGMERMDVNIEP